jgi:4-amino-4-deoxy-L-arabinose transferase-like glycosyltransferase
MSTGKELYEEKIDPLVEREVEVVEGKRDNSQFFHGRMSRWQYAWDEFNDSNTLAWLFGYSFSLKDPRFHVSIGIHNDYLRIFYLSGIIGSILYTSFLYLLWQKRKFASKNERYLLTGSLLIILLYSFSTTPTMYANLLYIALTIFAYFARPKYLIYAESKK